jgi:hypothetical protein
LRDEIVREHYDPARFGANINPACSRLRIGWGSRMDVPGRGVGPTEKLIKSKNNKLNAK